MKNSTDLLTSKKTWIWIVIEAILFGMFVYSFNQYYSVQIDGINQYPFRETVALLMACICFGLTMVIVVIHFCLCVKQHLVKGWLLSMVIMLAISLLLIDPLFNVIDLFSTWLFHLLPDTFMESIADWLEPLSTFLKAL